MKTNVILIILTFFCSCASVVDPQALSSNAKKDSTQNIFVDLEKLHLKGFTAQSARLFPVSKSWNLDDKMKFKDVFSEPKKKVTSDSRSLKNSEIREKLKRLSFDKLEGVGVINIIEATSKLSDKSFNAALEELLSTKQCQPVNVSFAFATIMERDLPDEKAFTKAYDLYAKSHQCSVGELKAKSAYRIAMFDLLNNDCNKALPFLEDVNKSEAAKYLFSRAAYWKNYCNRESVENKLELNSSFFKAHPLSYHSILNFKLFDDDLGQLVLRNDSKKAKVRTSLDADTNKLVEQIELKLDNGSKDEAQEYISWFSSNKLDSLEPEFLLYLGYLSYLAEDGLSTFQIFSKVFSKNPQFKSRVTMNMFYPKWHFEIVKKYSEAAQVDPLLVLSLVRQESAFNTKAMSRVGARGLMQIMPATARTIDRKIKKNDLFHDETNIKAGVSYFSKLLRKYEGNTVMALAAYNAGFGAVDKWMLRYKTTDELLFADLIPYRETREYVGSILRNYYWYKSLEAQTKTGKNNLGKNN
jgi:hypothetical protein